MEQLNIFDFLFRCLSVGCARPNGQSDFALYVYVACCVFNVARIITYVPTIKILLKPGCTGDGQSLSTWIMWIGANSTMSLHLYIAANYHMTDLIWINVSNTVMCVVCAVLIAKVQKRNRLVSKWLAAHGVCNVPSGSRTPSQASF
jgi:hypothetical protein